MDRDVPAPPPGHLRDLREGMRVTSVGAVVNVCLAIAKIAIGIRASSQALIADGIHSLSDLISDLVCLLGLMLGRKEADEQHPFGHARIETVASLVMGFLLILAAIGIAYNAVATLYRGESSTPGVAALVVAGLSVLIKEAMYWYTVAVGKRIRSLVLIGNAWHHRTDALSSVAVLAGVTAGYLHPHWAMADVFAALIVTYFVIQVGIRLAWAAIREVIDTAPGRDVLSQLHRSASEVEGVLDVHDIRARYSGSQIMVDVHIVVAPDLTVREGHDIAERVRFTLIDRIADVSRVMVHVDPQ